MSRTAFWLIDEETEEVEELESSYDYSSDIESDRPARGERDLI